MPRRALPAIPAILPLQHPSVWSPGETA